MLVAVRYRRVVVVVGGGTLSSLVPTKYGTKKKLFKILDLSSVVRFQFVVPKLLAHPFFFWQTLFFDNQPCLTWDIAYQIGFPSV